MKVNLKDIAHITAGNSAPDKSVFTEDGIPFIRAGSLEFLVRGVSIDECEKIEPLIAKANKLKLFSKGSILFAKSGMSAKMGRVYVLPIDAYVVSHLAIISVNDYTVNSNFVALFFNYKPPFHLIKDDAYPSINLNDIGKVEIELPTLEVQNKIVAILDKTKAILEKREKTISNYDNLLRSVFIDMFGGLLSNVKGWQESPLKEFGIIITGNTPPRNIKDNYGTDYIEWIKTNNIINESPTLTKAEEYLSEKGFSKARYVDENALLVTCIAGSIGSIGRSAITDRKVAFNQQINAIVPNSDVSVHFLYWMFKISSEYIQFFATKGMKRLITKGEFEKIPFIKPDYSLQLKFEKTALFYASLINKVYSSKSKIERLLSSLSQLAFEGNLSFNTAVDLEVLLENDYEFFQENSNTKSIKLLLERLDKNQLNEKKFSEQEIYDKAKDFVFELLKEGKIKQVFDENTKGVNLTI